MEVRQSGAGTAGSVFARLARLRLEPSVATDVELLLQQPTSVPALDIAVDELVVSGRNLGRVEVVLLIYLFSLSHALTAVLVSSVTFRLSLLALAGSASVLFIFGMVLRKAPVWGVGASEEGPNRGQETG